MAAKKNADVGQAEAQKQADVETDQGFAGTRTDPTPLENYTVSGVTSGAPTPETDAEQAAKAQEHAATVAKTFDGPSANQ